MEQDLPFNCEYAKSGRAACKKCKEKIPEGKVRLAVMTQSFAFDGKVANWHHENCFFINQRPQTEGDFKNFENLKPADQKRIREKIAESLSSNIVLPAAKGKGKKRAKEDTSAATKDFGIEYAKSARAGCRGCELKISKDEIRIKKVVFDTEVGMKYGGQPLWHHAECFLQIRADLGWFESGEKLPGFLSLSKDDQKKIKELIPAVKAEDIPDVKKLKTEIKDEVDSAEDKELIAKIEKQTKKMFKYRDNIEKNLTKPEIDMILLENEQERQSDSQQCLNLAADILTFGALLRCPKCTDGQFLFNKSGYKCNGYITDWAKCLNNEKEPKRVICTIPKSLKDSYTFLQKYKGVVEARAIRYIPPSQTGLVMTGRVKKEEYSEPRVKREKPALYGLEFVIVGLKDVEKDLKTSIIKLGGKVGSKIHEKLAAVISTSEEVKKMKNRKILDAKDMGIQVVPEDYIKAAEEAGPGSGISFITSKAICDWGTDPKTRIPTDEEEKSKSSKSIYAKSGSKSMTVQLKGGLAVDAESGLSDVAHVYVSGKNKYTAVLSLTDISSGKNSYYKIQILESDKNQKYWVFRAWGRIGTKVGGTKVSDHSTLMSAKGEFETVYMEKTGNPFDHRHNFVKIPGKMYPVEVDYGEDDKMIAAKTVSKVKSKLDKPLQNLINLMFDIETMKKVMKEFDLDTEKMPLGKLSQKQIQSAYKVLTEISELITKGGTNADFLDATNRFYTLIPHSFGMDNPPILDTAEQIKHHSEKLDSLSEIELAYSMLKNEEVNEDVNSVDQHYEQLKTKLVSLKRDTEEFRLLEKYVQNTHAETHRMYDLEIIDIFKVERNGETRRFKPFKKLHNRKLLWHGSRLTNYAGILSHGLKIAPPEAPVTGYMFGKGIYFADMVSKSANYCFTSKLNSAGILLLSEVALGDMLECKNAHYVTKLPKDKHSTKGIGTTQPNPKESHKREDGVEIPLGKPITDTNLNTSLLYNEFIVYDVAQVNIQYLFRMDFKYKY